MTIKSSRSLIIKALSKAFISKETLFVKFPWKFYIWAMQFKTLKYCTGSSHPNLVISIFSALLSISLATRNSLCLITRLAILMQWVTNVIICIYILILSCWPILFLATFSHISILKLVLRIFTLFNQPYLIDVILHTIPSFETFPPFTYCHSSLLI